MAEPMKIEDDRGVDIAQIHAQLRLIVPERVKSMVDAANALIAVQDAARVSVGPTEFESLRDQLGR